MTATDGRLPSSQPHDHLVYLRVFEGCNLHCAHCFIPANPRRFERSRFQDIPAMLAPHIPAGSTVLLQWHGGEPTLMGADYIREGITTLAASGAPYTWRHGIQTNLMAYDGAWKDLYHEHFHGEVGVSWDPLMRMEKGADPNSHPRVLARFEHNLSRLIADGLTPYVVVTAAKTLFAHHANPFGFFSWWQERGVEHVHLERITRTGYARAAWDKVGLDNAAYSHNMARWARAYAAFKKTPAGQRFHLSPFDNLGRSVAGLLAGQPRASGCWSGVCDTRFHTIDGDGYKAGCTALTSEDGNRNAAAVPQLTNAPYQERRDLRVFSCGTCRFRSVCKTGCLALDFDDGSGECSGGLHLFSTLEQLAQERVFP